MDVSATLDKLEDTDDDDNDDPLVLLLPNLNKLPELDDGVTVSSDDLFKSLSSLFT